MAISADEEDGGGAVAASSAALVSSEDMSEQLVSEQALVSGIRSPWLLAKACRTMAFPKARLLIGSPSPEEFIIATPFIIVKSRAPKSYPCRLCEMAPFI